jgi:hypothetical protein
VTVAPRFASTLRVGDVILTFFVWLVLLPVLVFLAAILAAMIGMLVFLIAAPVIAVYSHYWGDKPID